MARQTRDDTETDPLAATVCVPQGSATEADTLPLEARDTTREHEGRYLRDGARELGRGGIGRVLAATDRHLGREVAVKELLGDAEAPGCRSAASVARFLREARITGQLEHPNIVPVHELGCRADGTIYYTMRVVRGHSLAQALANTRDVEERLALVAHFKDACEAVAYAHSRGVVHRDLKPGNVMVGEFGETVVVDWGLAKVRGTEDLQAGDFERKLSLLTVGQAEKTVHGYAIGTPSYMSPEQALGDLDAIDERSDVWGLGTILYEILTGRAPFEGSTVQAVVAKVLTERPTPVRNVEPRAPTELSAIAERALARRPDDRYASAQELARDVAAWQAGNRVLAYDYSTLELLRRLVNRNRTATVALLLLFASSLVASVLIYRGLLREGQARRLAEQHSARALQSELNERRVHITTLLTGAEQALAGGDSGSAAILAAAALERDSELEEAVGPKPTRAPDEKGTAISTRTRARSAFLHAEGLRSLEYARTLTVPGRPVIDTPHLSPNGKHLAVFVAGQLVLFDLATSDVPRRYATDTKAVAGWTPDSSAIALVSGPGAGLVSAKDGTPLQPFPTDTKCVAFHENRIVVGRSNGEVDVYPIGTADVEHRFPSGLTKVTLIAISADGKYVAMAAKYAPKVTIRELDSGRIVRSIGLPAPVWTLAFDPKSARLAAAGAEPRIWLVPADSAMPMTTIATTGWVYGLHWDDTNRLVTAEGNYAVVIRDAETGKVLEVLHRPFFGSSHLSVARDGTVAASSGPAKLVSLWQPRDAGLVAALPLEENIRHLDRTADGSTLVAAGPNAVWRIDTDDRGFDGARISRLALPEGYGPPAGVAISSRGSYVAVITSHGRVALRDGEASFRAMSEAWDEHGTPLRAIAFSPDDKQLYAGGRKGQILRWDVSELSALTPLEGHTAPIMGLAFSPNGKHIASASLDKTVRIWSTTSLGLPRVLEGHEKLASDAAFSPDGTEVATVDGAGWTRIWNASTGELLRKWRAHETWINRCDWSKDWLVTASDDATIRVWQASTGQLSRILPSDGLAVTAMLSRDGRFVVHPLYEHRRRLVRVLLDEDLSAKGGRTLLEDAQRKAALRLEAGELVPFTP